MDSDQQVVNEQNSLFPYQIAYLTGLPEAGGSPSLVEYFVDGEDAFRYGALHPAPCKLHPAPLTLHPAPCTLHPREKEKERERERERGRGRQPSVNKGAGCTVYGVRCRV